MSQDGPHGETKTSRPGLLTPTTPGNGQRRLAALPLDDVEDGDAASEAKPPAQRRIYFLAGRSPDETAQASISGATTVGSPAGMSFRHLV